MQDKGGAHPSTAHGVEWAWDEAWFFCPQEEGELKGRKLGKEAKEEQEIKPWAPAGWHFYS